MNYRSFKEQCNIGTHVKDNDRTGVVVKISKDKDKALVKFDDGITEWIEYYRIEMI